MRRNLKHKSCKVEAYLRDTNSEELNPEGIKRELQTSRGSAGWAARYGTAIS